MVCVGSGETSCLSAAEAAAVPASEAWGRWPCDRCVQIPSSAVLAIPLVLSANSTVPVSVI